MNKVIITMTSWTKRINMVPAAIERIMNNWEIKIDKFYLWLSRTEFKDESEVPYEVLQTLCKYGIHLRFTDKNEYCHKRWNVYPDHWDDYVISIDDDMIYPSKTISKSLEYAESHKNEIVILADVGYANIYNNSIAKVKTHFTTRESSFNYNFVGQCIIPPKTFPMITMDAAYQDLRFRICNKCDECWLNPFLIKQGTKIYYSNHPTYVDNAGFDVALFNEMDNGNSKYATRDIQELLVLSVIPELQNSWTYTFPSYRLRNSDHDEVQSLVQKLADEVGLDRKIDISWVPTYNPPYLTDRELINSIK